MTVVRAGNAVEANALLLGVGQPPCVMTKLLLAISYTILSQQTELVSSHPLPAYILVHTAHIPRSRVYVTVPCPSVCPCYRPL